MTLNPSRFDFGVLFPPNEGPPDEPPPTREERDIDDSEEEADVEEPCVGFGGERRRRTSNSEPVGPSPVLTSRETGSLRLDG